MAVWILALIAIIVAFTAIAVFALPRLLFYTRYDVSGTADRGVKKVDDDDGQSIVFAPAPAARKYISSYALSYRDGKRVLVCKLNAKINYLDYDVIVFGDNDKVDRVFNVKDTVAEADYTHVVELPCDTDYVSLMINEADGEKFKNKVLKSTPAVRIIAFVLLSAVLIALAVFGIKVCFAYMLAGLFRESYMALGKSNVVTAVIAAVAVCVYAVLTVVAFALRRRKTGKSSGGGEKK